MKDKKKKVELISFKCDSHNFKIKTNEHWLRESIINFSKPGAGWLYKLFQKELDTIEVSAFDQNRMKLNKIELFNLN